ncbi:MAG: hypothetical protein RL757_1400 [Bacteroidota bacterium]|jgi:hypothetical protein
MINFYYFMLRILGGGFFFEKNGFEKQTVKKISTRDMENDFFKKTKIFYL